MGISITSAGITAALISALAMVEEDHGASVHWNVARNLIVFLRRPGGQAQFSGFPINASFGTYGAT